MAGSDRLCERRRRRKFGDIPAGAFIELVQPINILLRMSDSRSRRENRRARIPPDEAEQLAAFEAAKSGGVSVRVAQSIQKGETTAKEHGSPRPQDYVKKATGAIYAAIDRLGQVEGVPDKKALAALKEAKRKLDDLYKEVTSRKAVVIEPSVDA